MMLIWIWCLKLLLQPALLEINSSPDRLDLNDFMVKRAKDMGIKVAINTDAHHAETLTDMKYGVWVARRGWLTAKVS